MPISGDEHSISNDSIHGSGHLPQSEGDGCINHSNLLNDPSKNKPHSNVIINDDDMQLKMSEATILGSSSAITL